MKDGIGLWVLNDPSACRPHRLAEQLFSLCVSFEAIQNLVPWDSSGTFTLKIIESSVELLALR